MGLTQALVILAMAAGAVLFGAQSALACDCHFGGPVCQDFWNTPTVFVGRVEGVTPIRKPSAVGPDHTVRFRVIEALRGTTARTVELHNYSNSCHFRFAPGQEWVIYAFPTADGTRLSTSVCSRTAPLREALEDVAYGRAARLRAAEKGRIYGRLTYFDRRGRVAVPGVRITLDSERAKSISTLTDAQGRYDLLASAGTYLLTAALPAGMTMSPGEERIELPDSRACANADLWADYPGHVRGRVLDDLGNPVPHVTVELTDAIRWDYPPFRLRGVTDRSGRYVISGVEPGTYAPGVVIGSRTTNIETEPVFAFVGRTTMKSAARRVDLEGGTRQVADDLVLPSTTRVRHVSGTVVRADGRPAAGVKVRTKVAFDGSNFPWTTIQTDARGAFSFALVVGMKYRLVAEPLNGLGKAVGRVLDPTEPTSPLRLVLE